MFAGRALLHIVVVCHFFEPWAIDCSIKIPC